MPDALIGDLELVAYEGLVNAAEHAYPTARSMCALTARTSTCASPTTAAAAPIPHPTRYAGAGPLIHLLAHHAAIDATGKAPQSP
ncbi:hypothetical protein I6J71_24460 [Amycolatopsis sp. FDAARGOS 1241]|nr:hypothetical protein I6J71_24460 [Amycolatopsis sp. FDAARGOS 1241]